MEQAFLNSMLLYACMQICQRRQGLLQDLNSSIRKQMVDFVDIVSYTAGGLLDHQRNESLLLIQFYFHFQQILFSSNKHSSMIQNKGNVCLAILDGSNVNDGSSIILGGTYATFVCQIFPILFWLKCTFSLLF